MFDLRMLLFVVSIAVFIVGDAAHAQCGQAGTFGITQIAVSDDVIGRATEVTISNALPGAHWVGLAGLGSGSNSYFFGTLCLGTPAPAIVFDSISQGTPVIGPTGTVTVEAQIPYFPAIAGLPFRLQAVVVDPNAPFGVTITPDVLLVPTTPRLFAGVSLNATNDAVRAVDLVTDTILWTTPSFGRIRDMVRLPLRRWILVVFDSGTVRGFDEETGAQTFTASLTIGSNIGFKMRIANDESFAAVLGFPFPIGTPTSTITRVDLATGSTTGPVTLPAGVATDLALSPSATTAYILGTGIGIRAFDLTTMTTGSVVTASPVMASTPGLGKLFVSFFNGSTATLNALDLATGTLNVFDEPLASPIVRHLSFADAPMGPTLVALASQTFPAGGGQTTITTIAAPMLTVLNQNVLAGSALNRIVPIGGTNEWLAISPSSGTPPLSVPIPGMTFSFDAATHATTLVAVNPPTAFTNTNVIVQDSDVIRRAFVFQSSSLLQVFPVAPVMAPNATIDLGMLPNGFGVQR